MVMLCILPNPARFPGCQDVVVTGISPPYTYQLMGSNAAEQLESLQLLSQQMQLGQESLTTNISEILFIDKENFPPGVNANEVVVDQLFSGSEGLFYQDQVVCYASEGSTLLDVLELAGEALADVL